MTITLDSDPEDGALGGVPMGPGEDGAAGGDGTPGHASTGGVDGLNAPGSGGGVAPGGRSDVGRLGGAGGVFDGDGGDSGRAGFSPGFFADGDEGGRGDAGRFGGLAPFGGFPDIEPGDNGRGGASGGGTSTLLTGGGGGSGGGGGGGAPGGGGGGGGSGGAGGGGGGGGLGANAGVFPNLFPLSGGDGGVGGAGGEGGDGQDGRAGGHGGEGGHGGGGGGAIEIIARGELWVAGAVLASGGDGDAGADGSGGGGAAGNREGEDGHPGAQGENVASPAGDGGSGGRGGDGGSGGTGGFGRSGADGGVGGGGAGGSVSLIATLITGSGEIDVSGGLAPNPGAGGRLLISAQSASQDLVRSGVGTEALFPGPTQPNPFVSSATPSIPGLVGGAAPFGLSDITATALRADADPSGVLLGSQPGVLIAVFDDTSFPTSREASLAGFDTIVLGNLTASAVIMPEFGFNGAAIGLVTAGFATEPDFGGSGPVSLTFLAPGAVYAVLVPEAAVSQLNITYSDDAGAAVSQDLLASELTAVLGGRARVLPIGGQENCSPADVAEPFGVLDTDDLDAFLESIDLGLLDADLNMDGNVDFFDVAIYLELFDSGCP